jgi:hypothetical protein
MEVIELAGKDLWRVSYVSGPLPDNVTSSSLLDLAATVPGSVQMDLLALKLIEDPYKFGEELKQRWIGSSPFFPLFLCPRLFRHFFLAFLPHGFLRSSECLCLVIMSYCSKL